MQSNAYGSRATAAPRAAERSASGKPSYWSYLTPQERSVIDEQQHAVEATPYRPPATRATTLRALPVLGYERAGIISNSTDDVPDLGDTAELPTIVTFLDGEPPPTPDSMTFAAHTPHVGARKRADGLALWVALVKRFAQYLTDEEILVLRQQLC